jgi:hypothetical protein
MEMALASCGTCSLAAADLHNAEPRDADEVADALRVIVQVRRENRGGRSVARE